MHTEDIAQKPSAHLGGGLRRRCLLSCLGRLLLSLLLLRRLSSGLSLSAVGRGPESKVIAKQLHDEGAVTV